MVPVPKIVIRALWITLLGSLACLAWSSWNLAHASDFICTLPQGCEITVWVKGHPRKMCFRQWDVIGEGEGAVWDGEPGWEKITAYRIDPVRQTAVRI